MEYKIGEIFEHNGVKINVEKSETCSGCYFSKNPCSKPSHFYQPCAGIIREDKTDIIFVKVEEQTKENCSEIYVKAPDYEALEQEAFEKLYPAGSWFDDEWEYNKIRKAHEHGFMAAVEALKEK